MRLPLLVLGVEQRLQLPPLLAELVVLAPDLHLLELAQRAEPHIEDGLGLHVGELERLHQRGLRLVLHADDFDDLVDVEIDDEIAVEHLERCSILARRNFERRTSTTWRWSSHSRKTWRKPSTSGTCAAAQHVHVEREAHLELGQLEQLSISRTGSTLRLLGSSTSRTSSADSSRTSASSGSFFWISSSAMRSTSCAFGTW